jgi:hypothetical protein
MAAPTRMFRDRVVSLEQTQEIGEKHIDLLAELAVEALPGFQLLEHGLDHERDLYFLILTHPGTGARKRVSFTRMVLSDAGRLPALVADRGAPVRIRFVDCIRGNAERGDATVSIRDLLTPEERLEADEIEAEWLKKNEALLAARRAEEERREHERRRLRHLQEEARQKALRERPPRQKAAGPLPQLPGAPREGGRRRRRRGRGGASPAAPPQAASSAKAPPAEHPAPDPNRPRPGGGPGRRRRRRGRGRGSKPPNPGAPSA